MMRYKRAHPGDDLTTKLLRDLDRGMLGKDELTAMLFVLLGDGHATTLPLLGSAIFYLLSNPSQIRPCIDEPALCRSYIEEVLRFHSPVQLSQTRYALEDMQIGDASVTRGDAVLISLAAANRDPAKFGSSEEFLAHRQNPAHLAFGQGIHFCLGSHLARAQGEIALRSLFTRLPGLRLATSPAGISWGFGPMLRGPRELPVTFPARRR
jgi:cytochrome P450